MSDSIDITDRIERLATHEERAGIEVNGLYAFQDGNGFVVVNGEVRALSGTTLNGDVALIVDLLDENGRIIAKIDSNFFASSFLEFETFSLTFSPTGIEISKIRLYPKLIS